MHRGVDVRRCLNWRGWERIEIPVHTSQSGEAASWPVCESLTYLKGFIRRRTFVECHGSQHLVLSALADLAGPHGERSSLRAVHIVRALEQYQFSQAQSSLGYICSRTRLGGLLRLWVRSQAYRARFVLGRLSCRPLSVAHWPTGRRRGNDWTATDWTRTLDTRRSERTASNAGCRKVCAGNRPKAQPNTPSNLRAIATTIQKATNREKCHGARREIDGPAFEAKRQ